PSRHGVRVVGPGGERHAGRHRLPALAGRSRSQSLVTACELRMGPRRSFVVGGTHGIGREIAGLLVSRGHRVAAVGRKPPAEPAEHVSYAVADLRSVPESLAVADGVARELGGIDDLIFVQRYRDGGD